MIMKGIVVFLGLVVVSDQKAVRVTVYYESLCPASMEFITQQLYPTWKLLGLKYMRITFVPYGKAEQVQQPDGAWRFTCQHGPAECYGNKLQVCGLTVLKVSTTRKAEFVNCVMTSPDPQNSGTQCIKDMPANVSHAIAVCFNGVQGDQILSQYGDITRAAVPEIRLVLNTGHVPQVEFNKVYNKDDEEQAFQDLKSVICKKVGKKARPGCLKKARLNVF